MIKSLYSICAQRVIIDSVTNQASIIDILETVSSQGFPVNIQKVSCCFYLQRDKSDPSNINLKLSISLNDEVFFQGPASADFKSGLFNRSIINFENLIVQSDGILKFSLTYNDAEIGSCFCEVKKISVPPPILKQ